MRREGGVSRGREREWDSKIMVLLFNLGDLDFVFVDFSTLLMSFILSLIILGVGCSYCNIKTCIFTFPHSKYKALPTSGYLKKKN